MKCPGFESHDNSNRTDRQHPDKFLEVSMRHATRPVKQAVISPSALSILATGRRAEDELFAAHDALARKTRELDQSLSMMKATLEATTDGILVTADDGRVTGYNQRFVSMWRLTPEVVSYADHYRVLEEASQQARNADAFVARVKEICATAPPESFDLIELADGRVFERASRVQVVDGKEVGRVWSFSDITEREALLESERAARAEAERASQMKDQFLATLSHELRTPLSSILGWSQMLRGGGKGPEDLQKGLDVIERNARLQTQLIEDLLDMSRIVSGKVRLDIQPVQPISFIDAAIETLRPAAEAKDIRLEKILDPQAGPLMGDPGRLQQIVWNLLSNAIKFTPKNGRVQVLLERVDSHVEISVADTGIGIEPRFLDHVFESFRQQDSSTTRRFGGLGLGLSIVRHLTDLHGGTVRAHSAGDGCGATFTVHLPIAVVQRGESASRTHPTTPQPFAPDIGTLDLGGITVLVVDDETDARDLVARVLADCNARVLSAGDATEALRLVEKEHPDVLVSDIGMPDVDGYELLRRVRALGEARGGKVPAVALTAFARSEDRTRALRAGFMVHVAKPVEPAELIATVASVAGRVAG